MQVLVVDVSSYAGLVNRTDDVADVLIDYNWSKALDPDDITRWDGKKVGYLRPDLARHSHRRCLGRPEGAGGESGHLISKDKILTIITVGADLCVRP